VRSGRKFSVRGFTSLLIAWAFVFLSFTGVILYVTPRGRDANWTGWTLLGLEKDQWESVHVNVSILFLIFAVVHLVVNWKVFWTYLKKRARPGLNLKRELALATIVSVAVAAGAICNVPPFATVMDYNNDIKDYWSCKAAEDASRAPVAHAEDLTLAQVATQINLPIDDVKGALSEEGYEIKDDAATMSDLAKSKDVSPRDVFADIRKHFPSAGRATECEGRGFGQGRAAGRGLGDGEDGLGFGRGGGRGFGQGFGQGLGQGLGQGFMRGEGRGLGQGGGAGFELAKEHDSNAADTRGKETTEPTENASPGQ